MSETIGLASLAVGCAAGLAPGSRSRRHYGCARGSRRARRRPRRNSSGFAWTRPARRRSPRARAWSAISLTHRGEELLGQRGGLPAYRERGATFGIPLLHPWANRLDGDGLLVQRPDGRARRVAVADPPRPEWAADPRAGHRLPVLAAGGALAGQRARRHRGAARLRGARGADGGLPVPPRAAHPGRAAGGHADCRDDRAVDGRRPCAGVVRLASLPAPAGRAPRRVGGRAAGARRARARRTRAADGRDRARLHPARAARRPHLRRPLPRARTAGGVRGRGRRAQDRGGARAGLPGRAGLRAARAGRRVRLLRAHDRSGQRAQRRRWVSRRFPRAGASGPSSPSASTRS